MSSLTVSRFHSTQPTPVLPSAVVTRQVARGKNDTRPSSATIATGANATGERYRVWPPGSIRTMVVPNRPSGENDAVVSAEAVSVTAPSSWK